MTRTERDHRDGTLTPRIRARIQEAYRTAPASYCRRWEELQRRQATARCYLEVPGLASRFRAAGLSAMDVAGLAMAGESTVRRALRRDVYSPEVLAAIRQRLDDRG